MRFQAITADITTMKVDAIVNAANSAMIIGGGVDGAIHRAAGPELINFNAQHHGFGCPTGHVKVTPGFNLDAKYILHTVGPDMRVYGQDYGDALLKMCYVSCMSVAIQEGIKSIAFPAISTGIFGFDRKKAAKIAAETIFSYRDETDMDVTFACFAEEDAVIINEAIEQADAEIHHIQWSIGEYPPNDDDADFVNDLDTNAVDGVYKVVHNYVYGTGPDDGEAVGVTVKDGKFVLEPTLRACAEARNASGYWGHFLESLVYHTEDDGKGYGYFEAHFGS